MERKMMTYSARVAIVTGIFAAGFMCGTVTQRTADAETQGIGGQLLKRASESGGMVGTVAQLGTAISDMEKDVSSLQKNIGILKNVRSALGGGK